MALMIIRFNLIHICQVVSIQGVGGYLCFIVVMKPEELSLAPQPLPVSISRRNTFKTMTFKYCLRKGKGIESFSKIKRWLATFCHFFFVLDSFCIHSFSHRLDGPTITFVDVAINVLQKSKGTNWKCISF